MVALTKAPYSFYPDINGRPLESGDLYFGQNGLDAESNPIDIYSDSGLTNAISQPVKTLNGVPVSGSTPIQVFTAENDYSQTVKNKNGAIVFTNLRSQGSFVSGAKYIEEFGAKGDGTTDDSAAFVSAAALGRTIILQENKTYLINSNVPILSGTSFACLSGFTTVKSTATSSVNIFSGSSVSDNVFQNIIFDMPVCNASLDITPVDLINATNLLMKNCIMTDGYNLLHVFGGTNIVVDTCKASLPYSYGVILADDIARAWIFNGEYHGSLIHDGIKIAGSVTAEAPVHEDISIYNNTCYANARDGIDIAVNDGKRINVYNNILYGNSLNGLEFKLLDADPVKLIDSVIFGNEINCTVNNSTGISAIAAGTASTVLMYNILIGSNNVQCDDDTTQTGIKSTNLYLSTISDNKVYRSLYAYRLLASNDTVFKNNDADACGNVFTFATDGVNSPQNITLANNTGKNVISRTYYVLDASTDSVKAINNVSDAPIDSLDGTNWQFSNGPGSVEDKTANFQVYATHDGTTFTNEGSAVNQTFTLNDVRKGLTYTFYQTDAPALQFSVSPPAGVSIGGGGAGKDLRLFTDNGNVTIKAVSTTRFEIIGSSGVTITYEP